MDQNDLIVRATSGAVFAFQPDGKRVGRPLGYSRQRLENEPIRKTVRYYARRSASRPNEIKLQQVRPVTSIGEIEIDVEGDKIVGVRLA